MPLGAGQEVGNNGLMDKFAHFRQRACQNSKKKAPNAQWVEEELGPRLLSPPRNAMRRETTGMQPCTSRIDAVPTAAKPRKYVRKRRTHAGCLASLLSVLTSNVVHQERTRANIYSSTDPTFETTNVFTTTQGYPSIHTQGTPTYFKFFKS